MGVYQDGREARYTGLNNRFRKSTSNNKENLFVDNPLPDNSVITGYNWPFHY